MELREKQVYIKKTIDTKKMLCFQNVYVELSVTLDEICQIHWKSIQKVST